MWRRASPLTPVMRGLDPRIHRARSAPIEVHLAKRMDCRVKPGNDGELLDADVVRMSAATSGIAAGPAYRFAHAGYLLVIDQRAHGATLALPSTHLTRLRLSPALPHCESR
ncbi:hypothetical protein RPD_1770 [Rhodopseudomonas palustris BisB5]|uniref:Uncharacterized protein n=1 Tax=Rhodopseudomonas palustris (strain BisB5) TaxID=316057 RepID=Q13A83_RHOPS|nr:hypothetical protein RPD_1770 [Rhodopseudomonas palustris BisB5]